MLRRAATLAFSLLAVPLLHPSKTQAQDPYELLDAYQLAVAAEACDEIGNAGRRALVTWYDTLRSSLKSARDAYLVAQLEMFEEAVKWDSVTWYLTEKLSDQYTGRKTDPVDLGQFWVDLLGGGLENEALAANARLERFINEFLEARATAESMLLLYRLVAPCLEARRSELGMVAGAQPSPEPAPRPAGDPEEETPYRNRGDWSVSCPGGPLSGAMWLWGDRLTNKYSILSVDLQGPGLPDTEDLRIFGQVDWGGPVGRPPPLGTSTQVRLGQKGLADLQAPGGPFGEEAFVFYGTVTLDGVEGSWPVVSGGGPVRVLSSKSVELLGEVSEDEAVCRGTWTVY